jgi:hypothetical protein
MRKITSLLILTGILALALFAPTLGTARTADDPAAVARLEALASDLKAKADAMRTPQYRSLLADKAGPQARLNTDPSIQLMGIDRRGRPLFYTMENLNAAQTISTDQVWPGGGAGLNLTGANAAGELAIWDGGGVLLTHQEFGGRVTQIDSPSYTHYHPTHVAGTIAASGFDPDAIGMSPDALLHAYDWSYDESEMASAAAGGLLVSNHSYGFATGWRYSDGEYYWMGDVEISTEEDSEFGRYSSSAREWDQVAHNAPNYLIVKSAGNDRNDTGPENPEDGHYYWNPAGYWDISYDYRPQDGGELGYDCISSTGVAKNILTVGAISDIPGGWTAPGDVVMSSFSNWGPTDDGRIKPDLVANGIALYSATDEGDTNYLTISGTSMSAPNATGSINLLNQYYKSLNGGAVPRSATIKALLLHTCDEAGVHDGPDYSFGWGLMNTEAAAEVLTRDTLDDCLRELTLSQGQTETVLLYSDGSAPASATICWNDPAGSEAPYALDPTNLNLVNDLDLRIERVSDDAVFSPWILDPANPAAAASTGDNFRDNVEQVEIAMPQAGWYRIEVSHKANLAGSQDYSLVFSGLTPTAPDPEIHVAVTSAAGLTPVSVHCRPDGGGDPLTDAQAASCPAAPTRVDATITVRLTDEAGAPIAGFAADKITVAAQLGGWLQCGGLELTADAATDANGETTISGALYAGGYSGDGELLLVQVDDPDVVSTTYPGGLDGLQYRVNSSDFNADFVVDLLDVSVFATDFFNEYRYASDFLWDCAITLSDVGAMAMGQGASCPTKSRTDQLAAGGSLSLVFDEVSGPALRMVEPGQQLDAYLVLDGPAARSGVSAFAANLRASDNVVIHQREILGQGLNVATGDRFSVGLAAPRGGDQVALVRLSVSVTDDLPAYFWLESGTDKAHSLPTVVVGDELLTAAPVSGSVAAAVASLNDKDFQVGHEVGEQAPDLSRLAMKAAPQPLQPRDRHPVQHGGRGQGPHRHLRCERQAGSDPAGRAGGCRSASGDLGRPQPRQWAVLLQGAGWRPDGHPEADVVEIKTIASRGEKAPGGCPGPLSCSQKNSRRLPPRGEAPAVFGKSELYQFFSFSVRSKMTGTLRSWWFRSKHRSSTSGLRREVISSSAPRLSRRATFSSHTRMAQRCTQA